MNGEPNMPEGVRDLLRSNGETVELPGNRPLLPSRESASHLVAEGEVDLFHVGAAEGGDFGRQTPIGSVSSGDLIPPLPAGGRRMVVARGHPDTRLVRLPAEALEEAAGRDAAVATWWNERLRKWMHILNNALPEEHRSPPPSVGGDAPARPADVLRPWFNEWMRELENQHAERQRRDQARASESQEENRGLLRDALSRMKAVIDHRPGLPGAAGPDLSSDPLLDALKVLGEIQNFPVTPPLRSEDGVAPDLAAVADASGFQTRRVRLEPGWHRLDAGPLLGFLEDGQPVALVPKGGRGYVWWDRARGGLRPVTDDLAARVQHAQVIYRPLRGSNPRLRDILGFALFGSKKDLAMVILLGLAVGIIGLLTPFFTRLIFDEIIPGADRSQLMAVFSILLVSAVVSGLFNLARGFAQLRATTRSGSMLQTAVWSRLLDLPTTFFRDYQVGDLAQRVSGISRIRDTLSGATMTGILSSLTALVQVVLVFYYGGSLGFWALLLIAVALGVTLASGWVRLWFERREAVAHAEVGSTVFQLLRGMPKIKMTWTEPAGFRRWADAFAKQRRLSWRGGMIENYFSVFQAVYPAICSIVIFYLAFQATGIGVGENAGNGAMTLGTFLAFNAAFTTLMAALLGLGESFIGVLNIVPLWERSKPILQTPPETREHHRFAPRLKGGVELSGLRFRYSTDGPEVLSNVSMEIPAGSFTAVVGPSGSGKSTLLRLLLGFEKPDAGGVFYDGHDLAALNLPGVRRQIGTVLQNGGLLQGDILTNIIGSGDLTEEDAWEAARMAGLDRDIEAMPMGMYTLVSEGGGMFSGGQRQRLMIARALARKPKILFFDEATSALDNRAQETVIQSLASLSVTRLVIAHRLSTIRNAHCIHVLDNGRLVESGAFDDLVRGGGLFARIAQRQMIDEPSNRPNTATS